MHDDDASGDPDPSRSRLERLLRLTGSALVRDLSIGIVGGAVVGIVSIVVSERLEDNRVERADRVEDLRYVREASTSADTVNRVFSHLDLTGAPLAGLDLSGSDLRATLLDDAILDGTDLTASDLRGVSAIEARFVGTTLVDVDASCLVLDDEADPTCSDLREALMDGADLSGADLSGADLREASMRGVVLDGADLSGADLRDVEGLVLPTGGDAVAHDCGGSVTRWPEGVEPPPSAPCT